ncbi:MAG TPA: solute carrier family 23 protein, partial [Thermopolyspora sp.]
ARFGAWSAPLWPRGDWHGIVAAVLLVAIVAAVESLACAVAVDRQHDGPRGDLDRELTGQGVANMVSGVLGGLPVAGVIVRSTTNVRAGAHSRWSAILHGVWVLLFATAFGWAIGLIPMAALAALLVSIGLRMINLSHIRGLRGHREVPVYIVAMAGVIVFGLAEGVLIGLGLAALLALRRLTRVSLHVTRESDGHWHLAVSGSLTFIGVPRLLDNLRAIPPGVAVDAELNVDFMDHAAFEALHMWRLDHERGGGTVTFDELHDDWYAAAASGARVFPTKTPPRAPDRWWLPWAYRGRCLLHRPPTRPSSAPRPGRAADLPDHTDNTPLPHAAQHHGQDAPSAHAVPRLLAGTREFHRRTAPLVRPILTRLADGQSPSHLFITCSDSRLVPSLITASGPGDLFIVRNIGNLVPRHQVGDDSVDGSPQIGQGDDPPPDDSVGAAIEYAIEILGVRTITVCGHSGCGAMSALLNGGVAADVMPRLRRWLRHGDQTLAGSIATPAPDDAAGSLDRLCRANVLQQLNNLLTYPAVDRLVQAGRLDLIGLYFDIGSARVHVLNRESTDLRQTADLAH